MSELKAMVTFELPGDKEVPSFPKGDEHVHSAHESLHEALCKAIHEQDPEAIQWLTDNIIDIQVDQIITC